MHLGWLTQVGEALRPHIAADAVEGITEAVDDAVGLAAEQAAGARFRVARHRPQRQNALALVGAPLESNHQGKLGAAEIGQDGDDWPRRRFFQPALERLDN